jgi:hypothetical protein
MNSKIVVAFLLPALAAAVVNAQTISAPSNADVLAALASAGVKPLSDEEDWGCKCVLCLSNPKGAEAEPKCRPPIERLKHALNKGHSFPNCPNVDRQKQYQPYDACPDGYRALASGEYIRLGTGAIVAGRNWNAPLWQNNDDLYYSLNKICLQNPRVVSTYVPMNNCTVDGTQCGISLAGKMLSADKIASEPPHGQPYVYRFSFSNGFVETVRPDF